MKKSHGPRTYTRVRLSREIVCHPTRTCPLSKSIPSQVYEDTASVRLLQPPLLQAATGPSVVCFTCVGCWWWWIPVTNRKFINNSPVKLSLCDARVGAKREENKTAGARSQTAVKPCQTIPSAEGTYIFCFSERDARAFLELLRARARENPNLAREAERVRCLLFKNTCGRDFLSLLLSLRRAGMVACARRVLLVCEESTER